MDAADHFTRREGTRNDLVFAVQHASFGVDGHAAHGVVHARCDANGMERAFVDRGAQRSGATKIIVVLFFHKAVVTLQGVEEGVVIHPQGFSQRFWRAGTGHQAFGYVLIRRFVFRANVLIKDDVSVFLWQRDNLRRDFVAGLHFVEETAALLAHQDSAAATDRFGNQVRGVLLNGRVNLNLAHIDGACANTFQQRDTATGSPFMVGGDETVQIRTIFHDHAAVGAETAGRHHNAAGGYGQGFVLFGGQTYAGHFAIFNDNVAHGGIEHHLDVAFVDVTHQAANQVATHRRTIFWTVGTVDAHSARGGDVIQHDPARCQPFDRLWCVFDKATQQFRVVLVMAAFQGFLVEQFFAVLDAFYTLEAGFCGVHPGRSFNGVPADGRHFLDNQDACPFVVSLNRRRQTGTAAADNHHVKRFGSVRVDALFCRQHFTRFDHRFRYRFFHGFTLAGRAGDGVHVRSVRVENAAADLFEAGDELNVLRWARRQFDVGDTVGFEADVNHQLVGVILHRFDKHTRFEF
ncbi:hypothetical protein D3C72_912490 [compost metagenome]